MTTFCRRNRISARANRLRGGIGRATPQASWPALRYLRPRRSQRLQTFAASIVSSRTCLRLIGRLGRSEVRNSASAANCADSKSSERGNEIRCAALLATDSSTTNSRSHSLASFSFNFMNGLWWVRAARSMSADNLDINSLCSDNIRSCRIVARRASHATVPPTRPAPRPSKPCSSHHWSDQTCSHKPTRVTVTPRALTPQENPMTTPPMLGIPHGGA